MMYFGRFLIYRPKKWIIVRSMRDSAIRMFKIALHKYNLQKMAGFFLQAHYSSAIWLFDFLYFYSILGGYWGVAHFCILDGSGSIRFYSNILIYHYIFFRPDTHNYADFVPKISSYTLNMGLQRSIWRYNGPWVNFDKIYMKTYN